LVDSAAETEPQGVASFYWSRRHGASKTLAPTLTASIIGAGGVGAATESKINKKLFESATLLVYLATLFLQNSGKFVIKILGSTIQDSRQGFPLAFFLHFI
jgi:uncharacterized membrane protein YfcA